MSHIVTHPASPIVSASGTLEVHQVPAATDNFVWLLVDAESRAAAAIDGPDAASTLAYCQDHGLTLEAIINTHTHPDHIGINRDLERRGLLSELRVIGAAKTRADVPGLTEAVGDGDHLDWHGHGGRVLSTEGHIDGHLSYVFDDLLFCGDTLFGAGCGYLFDGPPSKMHASLTTLASLPPATKVFCAHEYTQDNLRFAWSVEPDNRELGERIRDVWSRRARGESTVPSSIELELATNPFLRTRVPTIRAKLAEAMPERAQDDAIEVFAALRALKDRKDYRSIPDSALPL